MKMWISLILLSVFAVGCSDSGSSKKGGGFVFQEDYKTTQVPSNAAPKAFVSQTFNTLIVSEGFIPTEAAFFNKTVSGTDIVENGSYSQERSKALNKLNYDGQRFVRDIQANCYINEPRKTEVGSPGEGQTVNVDVEYSTSGYNCPLLIQFKTAVATTYKKVDINQAAKTAHVIVSSVENKALTKELNDQSMIGASGIKSMTFTQTASVDGDIFQSNQKQILKLHGTINGNLSIEMSDGSKIAGPVKGEVLLLDGKQEARFLFDGQTSQGALRVVVLMTGANEKNQGQGTLEVYVNGEKFDAAKLGGFDKMFKGMEIK